MALVVSMSRSAPQAERVTPSNYKGIRRLVTRCFAGEVVQRRWRAPNRHPEAPLGSPPDREPPPVLRQPTGLPAATGAVRARPIRDALVVVAPSPARASPSSRHRLDPGNGEGTRSSVPTGPPADGQSPDKSLSPIGLAARSDPGDGDRRRHVAVRLDDKVGLNQALVPEYRSGSTTKAVVSNRGVGGRRARGSGRLAPRELTNG